MLSLHTSPLAPLGGKKTGGMNVYVRELAIELGKRGIAIDIFTRIAAPNTPEIDTSLGDTVRVIHLPCGPAQFMSPDELYPHVSQFAAGVIAFTMKQNIAYDVVYSHYWLSGWVAAKLKEVWQTPFVQMFHTLGHMKNRINNDFIPVQDTRTTVETQIVRWADRVVAATPAEHAQLLWLYRADRRKIAIVPPGVNAELFNPLPKAQAKAVLGLHEETKLLLFVGRIEPLKAVDTILGAVKRIRETQPEILANAHFMIIGGDPKSPDGELRRLMALANAYNIEDCVAFIGAKDQSQLRYYYSAATGVMMPSDYESFGMVALEAMASGTPVIASEVGGLAFLIRHRETGYLVPTREPNALADRIVDLLQDPHTAAAMGNHAAVVAREYSWSHIADHLLAVFEEISRKPARMAL